MECLVLYLGGVVNFTYQGERDKSCKYSLIAFWLSVSTAYDIDYELRHREFRKGYEEATAWYLPGGSFGLPAAMASCSLGCR